MSGLLLVQSTIVWRIVNKHSELRQTHTSTPIHTIENAFSKLKALLRKAAERALDGLWSAIGRLVDTCTPQECANYFAAAGYDAT